MTAQQQASGEKTAAVGRRFGKLRLLPVVMVVGTLAFGVKLGAIWNGAGEALSGIPEAVAQGMPEEETPPSAADREAPAQPDETAVEDGDGPYSEGELQILENLVERRKELDRRAREIAMREGVLAAMEQRIDDKIARVKRIEEQVSGYLEAYNGQHIENLDRLVKMYESMKPKDAARIFEQLQMDILLEVASSMKERNMAEVLAEMNSEAAKTLTTELATKKPIPFAVN